MKERAPAMKSDNVQRQASAHAGTVAAPDGPRMQSQGAQMAQLRSSGGIGTAQLTSRQVKGFNLGNSHSTQTPSGKTTSHKPGKGREENPRKSAALARARSRRLTANVANSQAKAASSQKQ